MMLRGVKVLVLGMALAPVLAGGALPAMAQPAHCPPGHAKKGWCTQDRARHLPHDRGTRIHGDWRRYGLRDPGRGRVYAERDGELYLVLEATLEVIEAIGAVDRVLRN